MQVFDVQVAIMSKLSAVRGKVSNLKPVRSYFKHFIGAVRSIKIAKFVAHPLNWIISVLVRSALEREASLVPPAVPPVAKPARVLFAPYPYQPTELLHSLLAKKVQELGHTAEFAKTSELFSQETRNRASTSERIPSEMRFSSVAEAIQFLEAMGQGDEILSTAIIDEFIRFCPVDFFFGNYVVSSVFQDTVMHVCRKAAALAIANDVVVVGDSAYLNNGALIAMFLNHNKKVYAADFVGRFREITKSSSESRNRDFFYSELTKIQAGGDSEGHLSDEIRQFFSRRYSGKSPDVEIARAFRRDAPANYDKHEAKKVLFLHSFRDANGQVRSEELGASLFRTYFEWTDLALSIVAEKPEEWIVKPHPGLGRLEGDLEILSFLLCKHGIPDSIVDRNISAGFVLSSRWPIFSHDGTIAREAATFGYRSVSISVHLPEEITYKIASEDEFYRVFRLSPGDVMAGELDEATVVAAKKMFFNYAAPDFRVVKQKESQKPGRSSIFNQTLPSRFCLTLALQSATRLGQAELLRAAKLLANNSNV